MSQTRDMKSDCLQLRRSIIEMIHTAGSGHSGGSLSIVEILVALYTRIMRVRPEQPDWEDRDRLVLSKGHGAPALYAVLARMGYFPAEELKGLRTQGSMLQGHPDMRRTPGVDMSTGSLGMGISNGIGMALSARLKGKSYRTYVICGDGELNEGQIWEAFMAGAKFAVDNLCVIVDRNNVQLDGTSEQILPMPDLDKRLKSFGWHVCECDGHDGDQVTAALKDCMMIKGRPQVIIAHTVKGKGVSFMEGQSVWHGAPITDAHYATAMKELT